jgi:arylsulfatase A-like enzyme
VPGHSKLPVCALFVAGVVAGAGVGFIDGIRAAAVAGADLSGFIACVFLTAGLDAVVGAILGALAMGLTFLGRWGRAVVPSRPWRAAGWAVVGLATAGVTWAAVVGTSLRNNRFLAAGVVCLAALVVGSIGAVLGPAVARLLGRRGQAQARPPSYVGVLLVAPAVGAALAATILGHVWHAHAPLRGDLLMRLALISALAGALLPFSLAWASGVGRSITPVRAVVAALLLLVAPAVAVVAVRWTRDFQYVRWSDGIVLAAIAVAGLLLAGRLRLRWPAALAITGAGLLVLLVAGASEPGRKAAARAGLVSPFLDTARVALDLDRDGYPWLLGGGDCNDRDAQINPAAQEWPDDGIDQNCDGKDGSATSLRSPPLHAVPDQVPKDLNLILVTIDTLRADHLGAYGYQRPTSPALDKLAAEGTLFENGWAHAPSTRYSMPALATGRWPSAISWQDCSGCDRSHWARIGRQDVTIGEALHGLGYFTGALYAIQYFRRDFARGFERGIDHYEDRRAALHVDVNGDPAHAVGTSSREMADDAIGFLEQQKDKKFFLWLHFYDPHLDYARHAGAPDFGGAPVDLYDGEIWFTDHHFGRVLDRLRQLGLWDRTAIVVTGDHGEGLGEHGINAHGYHLYPPQTKVPFIVRIPGASPRRVTTPVSHVDIAPTLLNLARGPHQPSFLGRSMIDLALGSPAASPPRPVFQEVTYECATGIDCTRRRALVTEGHHLVWNWMPDNTTECYDLRADPGELRDLWGTSTGAACAPLKTTLQDMVQALSFPPKFAEKMAAGLSAPGAPAPAPAHPLEARLGDSVRLLGYDLIPPTVARGGSVEIVYHFEALTRVPEGWRLFVHLDGPGGFRNLDHVPLDGLYPVERWRPGQRIRDRQQIVFPSNQPPGAYTVSLGFYRRNERMPVTPAAANDGADRVKVATIVVQ